MSKIFHPRIRSKHNVVNLVHDILDHIRHIYREDICYEFECCERKATNTPLTEEQFLRNKYAKWIKQAVRTQRKLISIHLPMTCCVIRNYSRFIETVQMHQCLSK